MVQYFGSLLQFFCCYEGVGDVGGVGGDGDDVFVCISVVVIGWCDSQWCECGCWIVQYFVQVGMYDVGIVEVCDVCFVIVYQQQVGDCGGVGGGQCVGNVLVVVDFNYQIKFVLVGCVMQGFGGKYCFDVVFVSGDDYGGSVYGNFWNVLGLFLLERYCWWFEVSCCFLGRCFNLIV